MKTAFVLILLCQIGSFAFSQSYDWRMENGKALAQEKIHSPGKSSEEIYTDVNRWLVKYFDNPEENLKAKIHGEYLRGVGQITKFITSGAFSPSDLTYTFIAKINSDTLTLILTDAVLVYYGGQDPDVDPGAVLRAEQYFMPEKVNKKGKKRNDERDQIRAALNNFSQSFFNSFKESTSAQK